MNKLSKLLIFLSVFGLSLTIEGCRDENEEDEIVESPDETNNGLGGNDKDSDKETQTEETTEEDDSEVTKRLRAWQGDYRCYEYLLSANLTKEETCYFAQKSNNLVLAFVFYKGDDEPTYYRSYDPAEENVNNVFIEILQHGYIKGGTLVAASFKVSDSKSVYFSKGNLQYNAVYGSTHDTKIGDAQGTWRFADHQYDYIGNGNESVSSSYNGWIDLLGFGTSGWRSGAIAYQPWSKSAKADDYLPGDNSSNGLIADYSYADWGVFNAISDGKNKPGRWRTLTVAEWKYLLKNNTWTLGTIEGNRCLMLIPENFVVPEGSDINVKSKSFTSNFYDSAHFYKLEEAGVVALPCAGIREGSSVVNSGKYGSYWSASAKDENYSYSLFINGSGCEVGFDHKRCIGKSVRLVRDRGTK